MGGPRGATAVHLLGRVAPAWAGVGGGPTGQGEAVRASGRGADVSQWRGSGRARPDPAELDHPQSTHRWAGGQA
jgi:hypothetical protein